MIWGFVDYENTGTLEGIKLNAYDRLLIFCGPKNNKIKIGEISSTGFCRIEIMKVETTAKNNLDFHLAFHLGDFHGSADPSVEFHVISNDTGFEGLVQHLRKIGRKCNQIKLGKASKKKPEPKTKADLSEYGQMVLVRLGQMDGRTRPRTKVSLVNWINSQFKHLKPAPIADDVFDELVTQRFIHNEGKNVSYHLKAP